MLASNPPVMNESPMATRGCLTAIRSSMTVKWPPHNLALLSDNTPAPRPPTHKPTLLLDDADARDFGGADIWVSGSTISNDNTCASIYSKVRKVVSRFERLLSFLRISIKGCVHHSVRRSIRPSVGPSHVIFEKRKSRIWRIKSPLMIYLTMLQ